MQYTEHMKRLLFPIALSLLLAACTPVVRTPVPNPDPNHTHADFAVWVNGEKLDFSAEDLMSESESEETDDDHEAHGHKHHPYLHLHDGVGHVIHRHKPGLSFEEFFTSLQVGFDELCYASFAPLADGQICGETPFRLFVNGEEIAFDLAYVFGDTDQVLITNAATDAEVQRQLTEMTDDACRYSKTCPWRGDPPAENCIADPAVPCVAPLD